MVNEMFICIDQSFLGCLSNNVCGTLSLEICFSFHLGHQLKGNQMLLEDPALHCKNSYLSHYQTAHWSQRCAFIDIVTVYSSGCLSSRCVCELSPIWHKDMMVYDFNGKAYLHGLIYSNASGKELDLSFTLTHMRSSRFHCSFLPASQWADISLVWKCRVSF